MTAAAGLRSTVTAAAGRKYVWPPDAVAMELRHVLRRRGADGSAVIQPIALARARLSVIHRRQAQVIELMSGATAEL